MSLDITCNRCQSAVAHVCHPDIKMILLKLYMFKPESLSDELVQLLKDSPYYYEEDDDAPFLSETFLYNLLGKEDARTLLATLHSLQAAIGLARHGLYPELNKYLEAQETVARCHKALWELGTRMRALPKEERDTLQGEKRKLMDEQLPAQRLLDMLDRWGETPHETARHAFLSAVSKYTSDDKLMHSLKDLSLQDFDAALEGFFQDLVAKSKEGEDQ